MAERLEWKWDCKEWLEKAHLDTKFDKCRGISMDPLWLDDNIYLHHTPHQQLDALCLYDMIPLPGAIGTRKLSSKQLRAR